MNERESLTLFSFHLLDGVLYINILWAKKLLDHFRKGVEYG